MSHRFSQEYIHGLAVGSSTYLPMKESNRRELDYTRRKLKENKKRLKRESSCVALAHRFHKPMPSYRVCSSALPKSNIYYISVIYYGIYGSVHRWLGAGYDLQKAWFQTTDRTTMSSNMTVVLSSYFSGSLLAVARPGKNVTATNGEVPHPNPSQTVACSSFICVAIIVDRNVVATSSCSAWSVGN